MGCLKRGGRLALVLTLVFSFAFIAALGFSREALAAEKVSQIAIEYDEEALPMLVSSQTGESASQAFVGAILSPCGNPNEPPTTEGGWYIDTSSNGKRDYTCVWRYEASMHQWRSLNDDRATREKKLTPDTSNYLCFRICASEGFELDVAAQITINGKEPSRTIHDGDHILVWLNIPCNPSIDIPTGWSSFYNDNQIDFMEYHKGQGYHTIGGDQYGTNAQTYSIKLELDDPAGTVWYDSSARKIIASSSVDVSWKIVPFELYDYNVRDVYLNDVEYDGSDTGERDSKVFAEVYGTEIPLDRYWDYDLTFPADVAARTDVGTVNVVLSGKGNYTGEVSLSYKITPRSITGHARDFALSAEPVDKEYAGSPVVQDPTPKLIYGTRELVEGTDYTVSYKNNKGPGTATIVYTGIGNFKDSLEREFKITAPKQLWRRLAGSNALATMREIVREGFSEKGGTVVIATNASFKDALSAAALAGKHNAPILMTPTAKLSAVTKAEIQRLAPKTAYIVGGELAVSKAVEDEVKGLVGTVERVAGSSASSTSVEVAKKVGKSATAIVATSADFADALSIAPWAYANRAPIILTNGKGQLTQAGLNRIKAMAAKRVVVVGGTAAVSQASEDMVAAAGIPVTRLAGASAVKTSAAVAAWELSEGFTLAHVACATRGSYKDALSGSALMGQLKGPIVLVNGANYSAVRDTLKGKAAQLSQGYFLGGEAAISADVAARIEAIK